MLQLVGTCSDILPAIKKKLEKQVGKKRDSFLLKLDGDLKKSVLELQEKFPTYSFEPEAINDRARDWVHKLLKLTNLKTEVTFIEEVLKDYKAMKPIDDEIIKIFNLLSISDKVMHRHVRMENTRKRKRERARIDRSEKRKKQSKHGSDENENHDKKKSDEDEACVEKFKAININNVQDVD